MMNSWKSSGGDNHANLLHLYDLTNFMQQTESADSVHSSSQLKRVNLPGRSDTDPMH